MIFLMLLLTCLFLFKATFGNELDRDYLALLRKHIEVKHQTMLTSLEEAVRTIPNVPLSQVSADMMHGELFEASRTFVAKKLLILFNQANLVEGAASEGFGVLAFDGHGDKYRTVLSVAQRVRKVKCQAGYYEQLFGWKAFDALDLNLKFTQQALGMDMSYAQLSKGLKVLQNVILKMRLGYEKTMVEYSKQKSFTTDCMVQTLGCIWVNKSIPVNKAQSQELLNQDFFLVLDSIDKRIAKDITEMRPNCAQILDFVLERIRDPLKRIFFKNAYEQWMDYETGILDAGFIDSTTYFSIEGYDAHKFSTLYDQLLFRMTVLHNSRSRIFQLDHKRTHVLLPISWSLAQYLKYMSRFVTEHSLRQELENRLLEFFKDVMYFLYSVRQNIKPQRQFALTSGSRICRHASGSLLKSAMFVSVPIASGDIPIYHYGLLTGGADNYSLFVGQDTSKDVDLIVYLSETFFETEANIKDAQEKIISLFCTSQ